MKFNVTYLDEVPSTSAYLLDTVNSADFHGHVVCAHNQTAGKGRRGRVWETGVGNLAFSVGFRLESTKQMQAIYFQLCTGIAVFDEIYDLLEDSAKPQLALKWPNDLVWDRKKLMGVLSQVRTNDSNIGLVIGVGMNVAWAPKDLPAICIKDLPLKGECPSKEQLLTSIMERMEATYDRWTDFEFVKKEWEQRAPYLGKKIFFGLLEEEDQMETGVARELHSSGALVVEKSDGSKELLSTEDLSLRL